MLESAAPPTATEGTVTVVGNGTASATPDTALLQLGVETRGTTPAEALDGWRSAPRRLPRHRRTHRAPRRASTSWRDRGGGGHRGR